MEVDHVSKQLLTINTHQGLYCFNRLPYGVKPAPGIFQQCMDTLITGIDGTAAYLDDMLVSGRTIGEHSARLEAVLRRIRDYGLRVRLDKCAFLQTEITYLGFVINAQGRSRKDQSYSEDARAEGCQSTSLFSGTHQFLRKLRQGSPQSTAPLDTYKKGCCLHMNAGVPVFLRQDEGNPKLGSPVDPL
ncbi:hypothetical protein RB195_023131 [Necator americanus]|uniref:Reverse transcriptase domain-containing protein n=1 Tax=Necator americanus TaxID=51031 RepID=A0ABR1EI89_NECAM